MKRTIMKKHQQTWKKTKIEEDKLENAIFEKRWYEQYLSKSPESGTEHNSPACIYTYIYICCS